MLCGYDGLACYEADDLDLQVDVAIDALAKAERREAGQVGADAGEVCKCSGINGHHDFKCEKYIGADKEE